MTIVDRLTPVYYRLKRVGFQRAGEDVVAIADLEILNADGKVIATDHPVTTLTAQEEQALRTFLSRELAVYESATGLAEWTMSTFEAVLVGVLGGAQ
jgi:hypothetical protein